MKRKPEAVFKRYDQNQPMLIPPSCDDLVPANHPVRVVNEVIERPKIRGRDAHILSTLRSSRIVG